MSLITNSNTYISELIEAGRDAMTNLYYVEFSGSLLNDSEFSDMPVSLKVRNSDFKPPVFTQSNHPNSFMTVSADMMSASIEGDKSLSFTFRLDSNYRLYRYLLKQQAVTGSPTLGWATNGVPDSEDGGFKISVYAFDSSLEQNVTALADPQDDTCYRKLYEFRYCWIKDLSGLNYTYSGSNPLNIQCTIGFFDYDDPMKLLLA